MLNLKNKIQYLIKPEIALLLLVDCILLPCALFTAVWLRLGAEWDPRLTPHLWLFFSLPLWTIPVFINFGLYRAIVKYLDDKVVYIVFIGVSTSVLLMTMIVHFANIVAFPRTAIIIYWLFALAYIGGSRFIIRGISRQFMANMTNKKRIAIYGAGNAGIQLLNSILHGKNEYQVIAFFDDDKSKLHSTVRGVTVYSPQNLEQILKKLEISEVLLAIPSTSITRRKEIIQTLEQHAVHVKTIPGIESIISGKIKVNDIKEVGIEDLLGRTPVPANNTLLSKNIFEKVVLVTGGGGSIGSELVRQISALKPRKLLIMDSSEFALYSIDQEIGISFPYVNKIAVLGSVLNIDLLELVIKKHKVNTIYHAAAYKHVPLVEANQLSGIENNTMGTFNVANIALKCKVDNMVLISTDKAVRPTNVMGASKRLAEMVLQAFAQKSTHTIFNMVRFGNVLGSSGSVVPLFHKQILAGGPITVTHPDIIRYFMTIPEAVQLVIQAGNMANGGEVFVLDMGEPVNITTLAKKMIYLSGLSLKDKENLDGDIEIRYTGLRPGEKLYEELLIGNNPSKTEHERIMKANETYLDYDELIIHLDNIRNFIHESNINDAVVLLAKLANAELNTQ